MKADLKKRLVTIQQELESLIEDHQAWMDDHEYGWDMTAACEHAEEEQTDMGMALDYIDGITHLSETR